MTPVFVLMIPIQRSQEKPNHITRTRPKLQFNEICVDLNTCGATMYVSVYLKVSAFIYTICSTNTSYIVHALLLLYLNTYTQTAADYIQVLDYWWPGESYTYFLINTQN